MRDAVEWSFSTATLQIQNSYTSFAGDKIQGFVEFNQTIHADKVFKSLTVIADEGTICDVRMLEVGVEENKIHHEVLRRMKDGKNYIAFEIDDDLSMPEKVEEKPKPTKSPLSFADALDFGDDDFMAPQTTQQGRQVEVCVLPGALAKEGTLPMEKRLSYKFRVCCSLWPKV